MPLMTATNNARKKAMTGTKGTARIFKNSAGELLDILIEEDSEYNDKRRHQQHDQAGGCQATAEKS
jgi:hypothetical protein